MSDLETILKKLGFENVDRLFMAKYFFGLAVSKDLLLADVRGPRETLKHRVTLRLFDLRDSLHAEIDKAFDAAGL
jgi:hypothetical protein